MRRYDTDNPADMAALLAMKADPRRVEVIPRKSKYGDAQSRGHGLIPIEEAAPDKLVPVDSFKEVIEHCHREKIFPMYHARATWCPSGFSSNQDGLPYCWAWSGVAWFLTIRALEDKPTKLLSPVSCGKYVNWRETGNYLENFIANARDDGICPIPDDSDFNDTNNSSSYWSKYDSQRKLYRLKGVWDCNNQAGATVMLQHALTCMACGQPVYIAYDFWSHALVSMGFNWNPSAYMNMEPVILNSHGERDWITVTGSKSIFSEAYGGGSTVPTE